MGLYLSAFCEHIVHMNFYISAYLHAGHVIYQPLTCSSCILQIEGHDFVAAQIGY